MNEPNDFVKARGVDLAAQPLNRAVFKAQLQASPWRTRLLSLAFIVLGIATLFIPHRPGRPVWILSVIVFAIAVWLLAASRRRE